MKIMFASDIHGSALFCGQMLSAFEREGAGRLCLLGDLLYHGPRNPLPEGHDAKRTAALLNSAKRDILCVRGNCDAEVDQMMLEFPVLSDNALVFADGRMFFLTHGHRFTPENLPPLNAGDVFVCGHTHVLAARHVGDVACINCGSVSLPKEGNPRSYAVYEDGTFTIKTLDGQPLVQFAL